MLTLKLQARTLSWLYFPTNSNLTKVFSKLNTLDVSLVSDYYGFQASNLRLRICQPCRQAYLAILVNQLTVLFFFKSKIFLILNFHISMVGDQISNFSQFQKVKIILVKKIMDFFFSLTFCDFFSGSPYRAWLTQTGPAEMPNFSWSWFSTAQPQLVIQSSAKVNSYSTSKSTFWFS